MEDVKHGNRFVRTNVVAGILGKKHIAVQTFNRATTADFFEDWLKWELLALTPENALVIIDNASLHRKKTVVRYRRKILY